jgi:hypothetical protein
MSLLLVTALFAARNVLATRRRIFAVNIPAIIFEAKQFFLFWILDGTHYESPIRT